LVSADAIPTGCSAGVLKPEVAKARVIRQTRKATSQGRSPPRLVGAAGKCGDAIR
jgi:hypothetical protein